MTKTFKLGWNSSDLLAGALSDLSKRYPDNARLKALYDAIASGSDEPVTIEFDDDNED